MSVFYEPGYESGSAYPMTHPRILWNPLEATATSSGAADGHPVDRVLVPDTSTWWQSTTGAAGRTVTLDFGSTPRTVDAIGIAGHNIGGDALLIEGATDDALTTWETLADLDPADDSTILSLVESGSYYGIRITITTLTTSKASKISVLYAGQALVMPVRGYVNLGPIDLGMDVEITSYRTESGQLAGRFIEYTGLRGSLTFTHLPEGWVRSTLMPFLKKSILTPFFIANRPQGYAADCAFAWSAKNVIPQRMGMKNFMSVKMDVDAHAPVSLFQ